MIPLVILAPALMFVLPYLRIIPMSAMIRVLVRPLLIMIAVAQEVVEQSTLLVLVLELGTILPTAQAHAFGPAQATLLNAVGRLPASLIAVIPSPVLLGTGMLLLVASRVAKELLLV